MKQMFEQSEQSRTASEWEGERVGGGRLRYDRYIVGCYYQDTPLDTCTYRIAGMCEASSSTLGLPYPYTPMILYIGTFPRAQITVKSPYYPYYRRALKELCTTKSQIS